MNRFRFVLAILLFVPFLFPLELVYSQPVGEPVILHPLLGTNIDARERNKLALFPEVRGFQGAQFVRMPGGDFQLLIQHRRGALTETETISLGRQTVREKFQEPLRLMIGDSSLSKATRFPQLLRIYPQQGAPVQGFPARIGGDSLLLFEPAALGYEPKRVALEDIQQAAIVRSSVVTFKHVFLGSALAGGVGAAIGFLSGDDPPGWFSLTAREKAVLLGGTLGLTTMSSLLIYKAVTGADIPVRLDGKSVPEKRQTLQRIQNHRF